MVGMFFQSFFAGTKEDGSQQTESASVRPFRGLVRTGETALGLSARKAAELLIEHGENRLAAGKKPSPLAIFAGQLKDLMTMILLASTLISVWMGETTEAIAIIAIVLMNAVLGFLQEFRTEKTLAALRDMAAPTATAVRDGRPARIPAAGLVPGDVILLGAGDRVPADARMLEAVSLQCDESLLSGESLPVEKGADGEKPDSVFMGTIVTKGRGRAEVTATGMQTEMGKIAGMLHAIVEEPTPLQKRLAGLGRQIAAGCLGICAVVTLTGILRGERAFDMLITGVSLAVAAVPEGLPAVVTISLALAVNRILKRRALVRRLHSVETLGSANVICSDKTGTLTENRMTVREIFTAEHSVGVSGNSYEQAGEFTVGLHKANVAASPALTRLFEIAVSCNNAELTPSRTMEPNRNRAGNTAAGSWEASGEPTELALLVMGAKAGFLREKSDYRRTGELPFDSDRKRMTVFVTDKRGGKLAFSKGAPELLLERCRYVLTDAGAEPLTPAMKKRILDANREMAGKALRVLGFAYREGAAENGDAERDMVFAGLAGMLDPPRKEAYRAVAECREAGIRTVMITGDHRDTAVAVAKDLGILRQGGRVMTGAEIDAMPPDAFDRAAREAAVFARVNPGHKLRIVRALRARGDIVAMTGDGVNDAPAVKEADVGVSMGVAGTDVTKEAASVILLDDNFATLVAAVKEGRVVYSNIRKFVRYLVSCNIGEVVTMFAGMLMGMPVILLPIQILLVNLVTDGLPAMALGLEPAEDDVMQRKPRPANESVFSGGLLTIVVVRGCLIGLATLAAFTSFLRVNPDVTLARTAALFTLAATQLFHVFECRGESGGFRLDLRRNPALLGAVAVSLALLLLAVYHPWLGAVLETRPLAIPDLLRVLAYSLCVPVVSTLLQAATKKKPKPIPLEP